MTEPSKEARELAADISEMCHEPFYTIADIARKIARFAAQHGAEARHHLAAVIELFGEIDEINCDEPVLEAVKFLADAPPQTSGDAERARRVLDKWCASHLHHYVPVDPNKGEDPGAYLQLHDLIEDALRDARREGAEAMREACAVLIEQTAALDDESELGEKMADAFNRGAHRDMNQRLLAWNKELAEGVRALPIPEPKT